MSREMSNISGSTNDSKNWGLPSASSSSASQQPSSSSAANASDSVGRSFANLSVSRSSRPMPQDQVSSLSDDDSDDGVASAARSAARSAAPSASAVFTPSDAATVPSQERYAFDDEMEVKYTGGGTVDSVIVKAREDKTDLKFIIYVSTTRAERGTKPLVMFKAEGNEIDNHTVRDHLKTVCSGMGLGPVDHKIKGVPAFSIKADEMLDPTAPTESYTYSGGARPAAAKVTVIKFTDGNTRDDFHRMFCSQHPESFEKYGANIIIVRLEPSKTLNTGSTTTSMKI